MPDKDYAHRDVTDKLGVKPGAAVRVVGRGDAELLTRVRAKAGRRLSNAHERADVILYWPRTAEEITPTLQELRDAIQPAGGIWVVTAKRDRTSATGMPYLNQDAVIPLGLAAGLVDNKACSVSENESAMRFVIRKKDRALKP
jgi:Protein of unknown function (DUF3052)